MQGYDLTYELNGVEAKQKEYLSTLSYLKLRNFLSGHELDTKSGRYLLINMQSQFHPYGFMCIDYKIWKILRGPRAFVRTKPMTVVALASLTWTLTQLGLL
jgi:hypothetical protein